MSSPSPRRSTQSWAITNDEPIRNSLRGASSLLFLRENQVLVILIGFGHRLLALASTFRYSATPAVAPTHPPGASRVRRSDLYQSQILSRNNTDSATLGIRLSVVGAPAAPRVAASVRANALVESSGLPTGAVSAARHRPISVERPRLNGTTPDRTRRRNPPLRRTVRQQRRTARARWQAPRGRSDVRPEQSQSR